MDQNKAKAEAEAFKTLGDIIGVLATKVDGDARLIVLTTLLGLVNGARARGRCTELCATMRDAWRSPGLH